MKLILDKFSSNLRWVGAGERFRSALGAGLGVAFSGWLCYKLFGTYHSEMSWFIAPMGATAVLVFVVHSSPLAQPWSVIGGNTVSALVGIFCVSFFGQSPWVAGLAVASSILAMFTLRCLHPPGGAVALLMVLSNVQHVDYAVSPVLLCSSFLVLLGFAFHNVTGKSYPHHVQVIPLSQETLKLEIEAVLRKHNEVLDISVADLQGVVEEVRQLHTKDKPDTQ